MNLRVHDILPKSRAQGPGTRYTVWVQGCSIHCPGCSNTDTWDPKSGYDIPVDELVGRILNEKGIDGVTITGGEPLDQIEAVCDLCLKLQGKISIFLTTGYSMVQLILKGLSKIEKYVDILCIGPFDASQVCRGEWKGSSNQEIAYLTDLGKEQSKMPVTLKEIRINKSGSILITGFTQ